MPQGKGTYGSKVGRPPKKGKKKYQSGGNVDPFSSRNPEGVLAAMEMEGIEEQNAIPTSNAMERSQTYQLGGAVKPPTAPSIAPTQQYKKGGPVKSKKVDITDVIRAVELPAKVYAKHGGSKSGAVKERVKEALAGTKKRFPKAAPEKKRPKYKKGGKVE